MKVLSLIEPLIINLEEVSRILVSLQREKNFSIDYKGNHHPITSADILVNDFLKEKLGSLFPEAYYLSEESKSEEKRFAYDYLWIVDPIDGTREFMNHTSEYAVSVGLVYRNEAILGAVALPAEGWIFLGVQGKLLDSEPFLIKYNYFEKMQETIKSFNYFNKELDQAKILVSKTEFKKHGFSQFSSSWNIFPTGSVARKLAKVAIQEGDLLISLVPKNEWDICGGVALLKAVGQVALSKVHLLEKEFSEVLFNKPNLVSYGLVAGNRYLVEKYLEFHETHQVLIFDSY
ncbi:MAG: hypothetical protein NZ853_07715 [Leptospiraceae bacterium]|nr:hypothetical protein [Leptospiraceae bacterium]MDW7975678.1 inositol monophosphatase family protein [Leptospiraceae bacterium]